ncbi:MAG: phosphoribosylglycinamide formyltransferase, partial [Pseudomonadota bacterium]
MSAGLDGRIAIMVSGRGSNLHALLERARLRDKLGWIGPVISDNPDAAALKRAHDSGIETLVVDPGTCADRTQFEHHVNCHLVQRDCKWVLLAGFMRILSDDFVAEWAGRIVNIHPSLLPAWRGLNTHARVLQAGCQTHGCSIHLVNEAIDDGPVLAQAKLIITPELRNAEQLGAAVLRLEHQLYAEVLDWILAGTLS